MRSVKYSPHLCWQIGGPNTSRTQRIQQFFDQVSVDRDRSLEKDPIKKFEQDMRQRAVLEMSDLSASLRVLDVGSGNARDVVEFANRGCRVVGLDLSAMMIREGLRKMGSGFRHSTEFALGTATSLPFEDESFDRVSCSETIEHIPAWKEALSEIVRVLTPGGRVVVTTPNRISMYGYVEPISDAVKPLLVRLGLTKPSDHPYDEWKTQEEVVSELQRLGIRVDERIGVCFVPSQATYLLPRAAQSGLIRLVSRVEDHIRYRLHGVGYLIGVSGVKV